MNTNASRQHLQVLVAGQLEGLEQGRDYLAALLLVEVDNLLTNVRDVCGYVDVSLGLTMGRRLMTYWVQ